MNKLLNTFIDRPTAQNAKKIATYAKKHPMATILLPADVANIVNEICKAHE